MGLITRALAKKLGANTGSPGSGVVTTERVQVRTVDNEKGMAVNANTERDVNGNCVSPNGRESETNEVLNSEIRRESEPSHTRPHHPTVPGWGTTRRRGKKVKSATNPRRVTQPTERKGGSSRGTLTPDISPDHGPSKVGVHDAKDKHGTSENTSIVETGRKRGREETSDADLQTGDNIPTRTKIRRIHQNIRRSTSLDEAPSVGCNLPDSTNANSEVEVNDVLILPASQYGVEHIPDEMPIHNSVSGSAAVCSGQSREKENASVARLTSSPLQRSRRKGTRSEREFVLAWAMLALSKPRISSRLQNNPGPSGERKDGATALSLPDLPNEAVHAPTWEAPRLDPDDFAFLVRRTTPYRFEESNMRNEAIIRPAQEE
ncbi:hypothetical protein ACEPAF_1720 [Sanghuangporus sanghuang]